jgi:hypothetical protein
MAVQETAKAELAGPLNLPDDYNYLTAAEI